MACYPCTHCNKCGMFSARAMIVCAECETEIGVGMAACPKCGSTKFKGVALPDAEPTDPRNAKH